MLKNTIIVMAVSLIIIITLSFVGRYRNEHKYDCAGNVIKDECLKASKKNGSK